MRVESLLPLHPTPFKLREDLTCAKHYWCGTAIILTSCEQRRRDVTTGGDAGDTVAV